MTFLSPLFLLGALSAAIPIVLHLLKREPEARVKFPAVRLLRHAPVENTEKRRIRELLLLALRVAALVLLAMAFARPFFASGAASESEGITVVALDTSLSLSAPGQFARAKTLAAAAIAHAPGGDLVGVVTFAGTARSVAAPTVDRALAAAAVAAAVPGYGATRYRAALSAASAMIERRGAGRATIVVVTDLQASGWDAGDHGSVPEYARVEVVDVGAPPPNLAVTALRLQGDRVVATIRNTGPHVREAHVSLAVDGRSISAGAATIAPNQVAEVELAGARGAGAAVSVDDPQGIQGDNVRYLVLDNAGRPSVLIVTTHGDLGREAFYLQQAIAAAAASGAAYDVEGVGGAQLSAWDDARMSRYAAAFVTSTGGLDARGRDLLLRYLRKGGGIFVAAGADLDGEVTAGFLGGAASVVAASAAKHSARTLAPVDLRHPVFQAFGARAATLGLATFLQVADVSGRDCQTLATFTSGERALLECAVGEGRALVFASDLDNRGNDFAVHATFVPFLREAVRYLSGGRRQGSDYLVDEVPAGVTPTPGIASVADAVHPRQIAVNVDPGESDPERLSVAEFQAAVTRLKAAGRAEARVEAGQQEDRQHVWQYVLLLMTAMLAVESLVATRTA